MSPQAPSARLNANTKEARFNAGQPVETRSFIHTPPLFMLAKLTLGGQLCRVDAETEWAPGDPPVRLMEMADRDAKTLRFALREGERILRKELHDRYGGARMQGITSTPGGDVGGLTSMVGGLGLGSKTSQCFARTATRRFIFRERMGATGVSTSCGTI